ncbi:poly-gamma-glutamate biosynthesis protein [Microbulbifer flavimaris]|uniref:Poly-gamma-glutamate biosynthesis protein n=1 Tax=Microbulbifer flavimaris TaxID=1781068 RepID=A0ABX4HZ03_9GAMM|nr:MULTISPECIES: CapA family protein [Microbulbifer]KUJ82780.1 poly-gamma-glutamate biosynthesis protein [Microbulbifer sp. ZGT114]PCO05334.1 poly-gamma-glutamate biosynthesis protein [Microbulbifer flavimaris]
MKLCKSFRLIISGDVMTGRGIDQILPHPGDSQIYEGYLHSSVDYVRLAETQSGRLPEDIPFSYPWGDALTEMDNRSPAARIINLETAVTGCDDYCRGKGINYRMHPDNMPCLTAAKIDVCTLANNHVLDWGYGGLKETLLSLRSVGLAQAGAGGDLPEASAPAIITAGDSRILVFACGHPSSGVPGDWGAGDDRPGINLLPDLSPQCADTLVREIVKHRRVGELLMVSIHWGGNWGYQVPEEQRDFAHRLVDAGVDLVCGHSSHHPKGIEIYRQRPIFYGCGDLINDYEGISGHDAFRPELRILYSVDLDRESGEVRGVELIPFESHKLRLCRATAADTAWLQKTLNREYRSIGMHLETTESGLMLRC